MATGAKLVFNLKKTAPESIKQLDSSWTLTKTTYCSNGTTVLWLAGSNNDVLDGTYNKNKTSEKILRKQYR